jgi:hypothetical protein
VELGQKEGKGGRKRKPFRLSLDVDIERLGTELSQMPNQNGI